METVYRDYRPKGVRFIYLYKALAHPELNGHINPVTLEERLMHVAEAERTLGSEIEWIADTMTNDLKHALGDRPNSEYLLDPDGKVLRVREWSDPAQLRVDLEEFVGPVENPTKVSDLDLKIQPPPERAPTGVVARIDKPGSYSTLVSKPELDKTDQPFYTKLRAEADRELSRSGEGKLYLVFLLDPLYGVHWNNLAPAMDVELTAPEGVEITPAKMKGPEVEQDADADPREFLVHVKRNGSREPVGLKFRYFACTDEWCKPVTQEYQIAWEVDRDGGRVNSRRMDFSRMVPAGGRGGGPGGPGGFGDPQAMVERLLAGDADGDDRLTRDELPEPMRPRFEQMDGDGDGYVEPSEIEAMARRGGPGGRRGGPQGGDRVERMMRSDTNADGKISRDEAPPPLRQRFDRLDSDGDGLLSPEEIRSAQ